MSKPISAAEKREYRSAKKRDSGRCVLCGNPQVEMHHIIFRSHGGINDRRNLVALCKKHHDMAHNDEKKYKEIFLDMMEKHYGSIQESDLKKKNKWEKAYENSISRTN